MPKENVWSIISLLVLEIWNLLSIGKLLTFLWGSTQCKQTLAIRYGLFIIMWLSFFFLFFNINLVDVVKRARFIFSIQVRIKNNAKVSKIISMKYHIGVLIENSFSRNLFT